MINDTLTKTDLKAILTASQPDNESFMEHEFNCFIQASPLRREIFNAIDHLENHKIQFIDHEFKALLNRWRSINVNG